MSMRWAKSYSIVDHQLLHGKYLHSLSHGALALYLFLVVVGDPEGKSFYSERTLMEILRFSASDFTAALKALVQADLIEYRRPHFWVKNLERKQTTKNQVSKSKNSVPSKTSNPVPVHQLVQEFLKKSVSHRTK
jgi:hypothetical protein